MRRTEGEKVVENVISGEETKEGKKQNKTKNGKNSHSEQGVGAHKSSLRVVTQGSQRALRARLGEHNPFPHYSLSLSLSLTHSLYLSFSLSHSLSLSLPPSTLGTQPLSSLLRTSGSSGRTTGGHARSHTSHQTTKPSVHF